MYTLAPKVFFSDADIVMQRGTEWSSDHNTSLPLYSVSPCRWRRRSYTRGLGWSRLPGGSTLHVVLFPGPLRPRDKNRKKDTKKGERKRKGKRERKKTTRGALGWGVCVDSGMTVDSSHVKVVDIFKFKPDIAPNFCFAWPCDMVQVILPARLFKFELEMGISSSSLT